MGYISVAFKAFAIAVREHFRASELAFVASQTVFLDYVFRFDGCANYLRLTAKSEQGGMTHSIMGLECIFLCQGIMGNMAVIADCEFGVTAPLPGGILRHHDMAVEARARVVREIRVRFRDSQRKQSKSRRYS